MAATERESQSLAGETGESTERESLVNTGKETATKPKKEFEGYCAACEWFKESPLSRWQFVLFLAFAVLNILWILTRISSPLTADIIAGIIAIGLSIYGANHFRILLKLRTEIERYGNANKRFKIENMRFETQVNRLTKARDELSGVQNRLQQTSKDYAENIAKFKELDRTLHQLSDDSIEGLHKIQQMSHMVANSISNELLQHERSILVKVMDAVEFRDKNEGLTEQEYNQFIAALPGTFQRRFSAMKKTFSDIAGADGLLQYEEFEKLADEFAVLEAKSGGTLM